MATPAFARGATLSLSPSHGTDQTVFTATFHVTPTGGQCFAGQVAFSFDSTPVGAGTVDPASCVAATQIQVPLGSAVGAHHVHGVMNVGPQSATASATFTVDSSSQTSTPTSTQNSTTNSTSTQSSTSSSSSSSSTPSTWSNSTTPVTPWTAPPFNSQAVPTTTGPCDTSGPHAPSPDKAFLTIPAYSAGAHPQYTGSTEISEPASGAMPITSVGPASMLPPQLGGSRYQYLEIREPIDKDVSPKLRLAAAAGEPFGCVTVETAGGPGSGYGYLAYALKGALVISVQDVNQDGTPFVAVTPTLAPTPVAKGKPTPTPAPVPKAKFEKVVLGYTSLVWEYQEAGGQQAPVHRGAGTIVPPPPPAPLSYSNLVFAFGGMVAATVALLFAYHVRRRDLLKRLRRQRATHA